MPRHAVRKHFTLAKLHKKVRQSRKKLSLEFAHVEPLFKNFQFELKDLRRHSAKMLTSAAIAGVVLAGVPLVKEVATKPHHYQQRVLNDDQINSKIREALQLILPDRVGPLSQEKEQQIETAIQENLGLPAVASLDGNHLNTTFGFIGAEQHLPRYPGDVAEAHDAYQFKGVTPGRGAWGYFAPSRSQLTEADIQKEKYYVAVQTLYLPNWKKDLRTLVKWYKHRKVIVVNPKNGKSVVAVVADAGPAAWTGKHFGGSPEVMADLGLNTGMQKGAVVLFFVDDQDQKIALGPVNAHFLGMLADR